VIDWFTTTIASTSEGLPMTTLPFRTWVRNAAAVFSGAYGAITRQAEQAGCSRETLYQHARRVEQQLDSAGRRAEQAELHAETQRLRDQVAALSRRCDQSVVCDQAKLRQVATVAFAAGVSLRQIEDLLKALLPPEHAPDHSTIGRWVADEAAKAKRVLEPLDAACVAQVRTLALDEIFLGGDRLWSASSRPA
jgi:AcrR family transcriptional regulator